MPRLKLDLPALDLVTDILSKELSFIPYTTQLRNCAYLIQHSRYMRNIYRIYNIDRGQGVMFRYSILRINADTSESILFCVLKAKGIKVKEGRGKLSKYIEIAKSIGLLNKNIAELLKKVNDARNNLHPSKQSSLFMLMDEEFLSNSLNVVENLITDLSENIKPKGVKNVIPDSMLLQCPYCLWNTTEQGELCMYCGNYNF